MKIEIGESLILSWLKHINNCQVVQLNWKASTTAWEYYNDEKIDHIINRVQEYYSDEYDIFKKNKGASQIIRQGEIDALGMVLKGKALEKIYAVDVAFHESGVNYGDKKKTVAKIISKLTRMAITMYGYFDNNNATIIFASPKITPSIYKPLKERIDELSKLFRNEFDLDFDFQLICNDEFKSRMIDQLDIALKEVADTSELYMRSIQMYKMFEKNYTISDVSKENKLPIKKVKDLNEIEISNDYKDIKIGALVRLTLQGLIESNQLSDLELEKLQNENYSKEVFGVNYSIVKKYDETLTNIENRKVGDYSRYYSFVVSSKKVKYMITNQWFEWSKEKYIVWLNRQQ